MLKKFQKSKINIYSIIGFLGILVLGIIKEFVPSLSFLTTGFPGLVLVAVFLFLGVQGVIANKKKSSE